MMRKRVLEQIGEKVQDKKFRFGKKAYDRVNREALWQVLRMYDGVNCWVELRVCMPIV